MIQSVRLAAENAVEIYIKKLARYLLSSDVIAPSLGKLKYERYFGTLKRVINAKSWGRRKLQKIS